MADSPYTITGTTTLHEGWSRLVKLHLRLPDGETVEREVLDRGAAVAVLPYDRHRRTVVLARQFRPAVLYAGAQPLLLEAPAGVLDDEDPESCARREAQEEVGLTLRSLEPVAVVWSSPGAYTERVHLFLAPYAPEDRASAGGGLEEEHEDIEVVELPIREVMRMMDAGAIADLKTLALLQALLLRHPDMAV